MEAVVAQLGFGPAVASWKVFAKNFITMNVLSHKLDNAKHMQRITKAITALGNDDDITAMFKSMGGVTEAEMINILARKKECLEAVEGYEANELDETLQKAEKEMQMLKQTVGKIEEEYEKAKDSEYMMLKTWLPMMDGTLKPSRRQTKAPAVSAAALVEQQEKVDEMKINIEKLHKLRPTEKGEAMLKDLASASVEAQAFIVLCAAWAQLCNSNFNKECAEGKAAREAMFEMKEILNSEAVTAADSSFLGHLVPVMSSWGFDMTEAPAPVVLA